MIIGVTGAYGAGKKSIAEVLQKMNFYHVSFSDLLREELGKRGKKINRENLMALGTELRKDLGADILAQMALETVLDGENYVFTSVRHPTEVEFLQERNDFLLVNVVAPEAQRMKRILQRNYEEDPKTLKELRKNDALDSSNDPNAQQLQTVAKMAKITIINDGSLEKLQGKVEKLVKDQMYKLQPARPDWDHYFMGIAEQVKMRASCMSARKGSIIVQDKMIISSGYNGTPKGIEHCNKGGCERCTSRHLGKMKSGEYKQPCICCHSEENAIVQAAYNGVCTKGGVLYTTFTPCTNCAKMIINAGIKKVVAKTKYPDDVGTRLLQEAGVELVVLK